MSIKSSLFLFFWPVVFLCTSTNRLETIFKILGLILLLEKDILPHKKWSVISLENVQDPNLFANLFSFTKKPFKIKLVLLYSIICKLIHGINWTWILSIWQLGGKSTRFSKDWKPGLIFLAFINGQYATDNFCFTHCQSTLLPDRNQSLLLSWFLHEE